MSLNPRECILFSGGARGAEAQFGASAERLGIEEVNFTFDGHQLARTRGIRVLNHEELQKGDVSLSYVSRLMHRAYAQTPTFRKILQSIWYQINSGQEIYVVGKIQEDTTVKGGTGWGAEFAKLCNKPLFVFDQEKDGWFAWKEERWGVRVPSLHVLAEPLPCRLLDPGVSVRRKLEHDLATNGRVRVVEERWEAILSPMIRHPHFTGTGTRLLEENGQRAIAQLFDRSFGK